MIEASCHCGAVRFEIAAAPEEITVCNCSICRRLGALWAYYPLAQVHVAGATATYRWGDGLLDFHHCARCGCPTHWSDVDPNQDRVAVNARLMAPAALAGARRLYLDGADTWATRDEPWPPR